MGITKIYGKLTVSGLTNTMAPLNISHIANKTLFETNIIASSIRASLFPVVYDQTWQVHS